MTPKTHPVPLELLCEVVSTAPLVLFAMDAQGVVTMTQGRGLEALGLKPGDHVGQSLFDLYAEHPLILDSVRRVLKGESFTAVLPLGDFLYETRFSPLLDWGGKVLGAAAVAVDVSLTHAAALAKDEYLSQLAHELRTPLTTASGWAWLLTQGELSGDEVRHAHEAVARSIEDLRRMLNEIRDMAAASEGRLRVDSVPVELDALLREAGRALQGAVEARALRLSIDAPRLSAVGDPARLRQAFWHLLSNAVKFSPPGAEVRATLAVEGGRAVLTVSDDGPGVDPELRTQLFDRARTWAPDRKARPRGLGLGLALVRAVAELHGGDVSVAMDGPGARFILRLPLPSSPKAARPPSARASAAPSLAGLDVLVACGDADAGRLAAAALRGRGARTTVSDEKGAAAALRRCKPGLLVTDLVDPRTGACPLLKSLPASARALALLTDDEPLREKALKAGFAACVAMPPDPRELTAAAASLASGLSARSRPS
jgi:signal transduction histidine kinase/CheY-like chemotaxis protein